MTFAVERTISVVLLVLILLGFGMVFCVMNMNMSMGMPCIGDVETTCPFVISVAHFDAWRSVALETEKYVLSALLVVVFLYFRFLLHVVSIRSSGVFRPPVFVHFFTSLFRRGILNPRLFALSIKIS